MNAWLRKTLRQAAWAPLTVLALFAIASLGFDAYGLYPWLDIPTHFLGGMAMGYFFLAAIGQAQLALGPIDPLIQRLLAIGLTGMTAMSWEFLEFASDQLLGTTMNYGVQDTLSDLFFGLLGGLVVLAFLVRAPSANS
ncbi:MAG: hypothetical protein V4508_20720 [Pseudomonadota bacterium]